MKTNITSRLTAFLLTAAFAAVTVPAHCVDPYTQPISILFTTGAVLNSQAIDFGATKLKLDGVTLEAKFQPLDSDLTAISQLTTTSFGRGALEMSTQALFRSYIGAGTSSFDGAFSSLSGKPTSLSGYGITDSIALTTGSYANPAWITSLAASKLTGAMPAISGASLTGITATQVGLGSVTNDAQLKASQLDTDGTLAANSDTKVASQKAVRTYVAANAGGGSSYSDPHVYYVRSNGNDTTGDGSRLKPWLTGDKAYTAGVTAGAVFAINFGTGSFSITTSTNWGACACLIGQGFAATLADSPTLVTINSNGTDGTNANGGDAHYVQVAIDNLALDCRTYGGGVYSSVSGGHTGGTGRYAYISGFGLISVDAHGGNGSEGSSDGFINGGQAGGAQLSGPLTLASDGFIDARGGNPFAGGSNGADGAIVADCADLRGSVFPGSGTVEFGRCSYSSGSVTPTTDHGGNASY